MTARSLYLGHFQLDHPPFRQEPDPAIFFDGAGRGEVLQHLVADIRSGRNFIKLTGSEGVGKTMLQFVLTERLRQEATYEFVCLDHPTGSFGELLRIICLALQREADTGTQERDYPAELLELLRQRREKGIRVVLIIDEAEKVFLATLERLVRLLCDPELHDVLQVLLVGRSGLDQNLDQLAIYCTNLAVGTGYVLQPLTWKETDRYLQFRLKMAGLSGGKHRHLFSAEAVDAIHQAAGGNMSLTNMFAEKGMQAACREGMFRVGPAQIFPPADKKRDLAGSLEEILGRLTEYRWWILGGALLLLVVLAVALWPAGPERGPAEVAVPEEEKAEMQEPETEQPEDGRQAPVAESGEDEGTPGGDAARASGRQDDRIETEEGPPEPAEAARAGGDQEEVVVQADGKKRRSDVLEAPAATEMDADEIYRERLRATSNWLAWSYKGGFTIQLMVLASEEAEENLKSLLVNDNYFGVRENLYILRKTSPPAVFMFYGLFDSRRQARKVLDTLPEFLRKHDPYVLSIIDALEKTVE